MKIFLDDIRTPYDESWTLARNFEEFKRLILNSKNSITELSFDHDLGDNEPSGYDATKWFIRKVLDNPELINNLEKIIVHTDNPPGGVNIQSYFESAQAQDVIPKDITIIRRPAMLLSR